MAVIRGVAQSGRVLALGARCRRFESFRPDQRQEKPWLSTALIVYSAENAEFYIQKCTVCDFQNAKSAQFSDITYTGNFRTVNSIEKK